MKKRNAFLFVIIGALALSIAPLALALTTPYTGTIPAGAIQSTGSLEVILCGLLNWVFWGLIIFSIVMFLVGGYKYTTSGGDPERVRGATKTLTFAVIGVVVALVAAGVPYLVGSLFQTPTSSLNACNNGSSVAAPNGAGNNVPTLPNGLPGNLQNG